MDEEGIHATDSTREIEIKIELGHRQLSNLGRA